MRIALISDAWRPQVNGVVRTWDNVTRWLLENNHDLLFIEPGMFRTMGCPGYPDIKLALFPGRAVARAIDDFQPEAIHIATEGPLGVAARKHCGRRSLPFTTSFHTAFPEYLHAYLGMPEGWGYRFLRWFHQPAVRTLVPTESVRANLFERGFANLVVWGRGVNGELFRPDAANPNGNGHPARHDRPQDLDAWSDLPRPIFLNVGRVATEKNLPAFAELKLPGSKVVIGDGPKLKKLQRRYPRVRFEGYLSDDQLARRYAAADVFVFPSRTDTFGNVMLEALSSGTPVAAHPVTGPLDVIDGKGVGVLDEDLQRAADQALEVPREQCRGFAQTLRWGDIAQQFVDQLEPLG